jgi:hypothetical protein
MLGCTCDENKLRKLLVTPIQAFRKAFLMVICPTRAACGLLGCCTGDSNADLSRTFFPFQPVQPHFATTFDGCFLLLTAYLLSINPALLNFYQRARIQLLPRPPEMLWRRDGA